MKKIDLTVTHIPWLQGGHVATYISYNKSVTSSSWQGQEEQELHEVNHEISLGDSLEAKTPDTKRVTRFMCFVQV